MAEFFKTLPAELDRWLKAKIISAPQKEKIAALYGDKLKVAEKAESSGKIINTITIIGSIMVGVGAILFVASHWDEIPNIYRVLILLAVTFLSYIGGYILAYQKANYPLTGRSLIFLGALFFGASVFLIAQTYHVNANAHELLFLWFIGVIPLAYIFLNKEISALFILIFSVWLGFYLVEGFDAEITTFNIYLLYGIFLYLLSIIHRQSKLFFNFSFPFELVSILITLGVLFFFSFKEPLREVLRDLGEEQNSNILPFIIGNLINILLVGFLLIRAFIRRQSARKFNIIEASSIATLIIINLFLELIIRFNLVTEIYNYTTWFVIAYNLILFALIIALIYDGYMRKRIAVVHIALLFFVIDVIGRYFDLFYDLLPRSLFFIVGGLILLIGGLFMEKQRKKLLAKMQDGTNLTY